jgi:hypothetical protein
MTRTFQSIMTASPTAIPAAALALALLLGAGRAHAQQPDLPRPSPTAMVGQKVGLTDIRVEYSSPGVRGRTVFGELVPYGELWRTGANAATRITFSRDVTVGGKPVPAGTYALLSIPKKDGDWTVILNQAADLPGTRGYDPGKDAARLAAKTETIPKRERLTFVFADTTDDATSLDLEWDDLRVRIPIATDTAAHAAASLDAAVRDAARTQANAARFLLEQKQDTERALTLIEASIRVEPSWYAYWIQAQLLKAAGRDAEARAAAQTSYELGQKAEFFFWEAEVKRALEEWK